MLKHWGEMTAADFAALDEQSVAILPVAATEQHGPHLPAGTDAFILDGILRAASRLAGPVRGIVLPLQPIGWSPEHGGLPGTLSLAADRLADAWVAIARWSARAGLRRLLILNSHGGNPPAMADLPIGFTAQQAPEGAVAPDWHAGWVETSVMLQLRPDLVRMDRAVPGTWHHPEGLPPGGPSPWAWMTTDISANGVIGDPRLASADLGARLVERAVSGLATLLDRLAAAPWPPSR